MGLNLYHALSQINKIKRKELVLPIAKKQVVVSPLSVGDDLILKTALISPVKLDKELMRLLWKHTEFWFPNNVPPQEQHAKRGRPKTTKVDGKDVIMPPEKNVVSDNSGGVYKQISERDFYTQISYFDKLMLLWGIYNITYVTLGEQEIECPECNEKFREEIYLDDTMHEDSITLFESDVPFSKFSDTITIPMNDDFILEFTVCIPSMADFNRILGLVSVQELQSNLENIRSQFNTEQVRQINI